MNEQDTGLMEKQYLTSENLPSKNYENQKAPKNQQRTKFRLPNPKKTILKIKQTVFKLKSPKTLIIFSIVVAILIVFLAILSLSSRSNFPPAVDIVDFLPSSPTPVSDPNLQNLKTQVDQFNNDLNKLRTDTIYLTFPQVDLNISF